MAPDGHVRSTVVQRSRLSDSLTWWTAPHPAWTPDSRWPEAVGFVGWRGSDSYVLVDPLIRDDLSDAAWEPFDALAETSGRIDLLLTAPWHERSVRAASARYGAAVWIHPAGRARVGDLPELHALPDGIELFRKGSTKARLPSASCRSGRSSLPSSSSVADKGYALPRRLQPVTFRRFWCPLIACATNLSTGFWSRTVHLFYPMEAPRSEARSTRTAAQTRNSDPSTLGRRRSRLKAGLCVTRTRR